MAIEYTVPGIPSPEYRNTRELVKKIGLKPAWKKPPSNGGLDGVLAKYEMY